MKGTTINPPTPNLYCDGDLQVQVSLSTPPSLVVVTYLWCGGAPDLCGWMGWLLRALEMGTWTTRWFISHSHLLQVSTLSLSCLMALTHKMSVYVHFQSSNNETKAFYVYVLQDFGTNHEPIYQLLVYLIIFLTFKNHCN